MYRGIVRISLAVAVAIAIAGSASAAPGGGKKTKIDVPMISCAGSGNDYVDIQVCAPSGATATGLPAGFSIHWTTADALAANGGIWPATDGILACGASFAGNANLSRYNLLAGQCVTVRIGSILLDSGASTNCPNNLLPCTRYVFRAFGHANGTLNRSDFSSNLSCSTAGCGGGCDPNVKSFGYWKQHPEAWPAAVVANGLMLGTVSYTAADLMTILGESPNIPGPGANGLITLAHQLINAKINLANGASANYVLAVAADIAAADAMIGGLVIPTMGSGYLAPATTSALTLDLDAIRGTFECPEAP